MNDIVASSDPGSLPRPSRHTRPADLVGDNLIADQPIPRAVLAEQLHELDADLGTELAGIVDNSDLTTTPVEPSTLPGFDTLTTRDLLACPHWYAYGHGHPHGDGFDPSEQTAPHRSTELRFNPHRGGTSIDASGPAEISLDLEQDRDLTTEPLVTLDIAVKSIEQYATLGMAEAQALHNTIGQLLDQAD